MVARRLLDFWMVIAEPEIKRKTKTGGRTLEWLWISVIIVAIRDINTYVLVKDSIYFLV